MVIQSKKVWLADQFVPAAIEVNDGRITAILPYGSLFVAHVFVVLCFSFTWAKITFISEQCHKYRHIYLIFRKFEFLQSSSHI